MLLKLNNPRLLVDGISVISELVTEVKAKINKRGFSIIAIDPANVALVMLKIPASAFSQFQVDNEEILGLNLNDLKKVLKRTNIGGSLVIEKQDNILRFEIQDKVKRSFSLALIALEQEEKMLPELEFTNRIEMDSTNFAEAINDAAIVADACMFISNKDFFAIESKGLNQSRTEFTSDEAKLNTQDAKSKYSLEYLQKFIKAGKIADKIIIQFAKDYPLRVDFKNSEGMELIFVLAPRVETEE